MLTQKLTTQSLTFRLLTRNKCLTSTSCLRRQAPKTLFNSLKSLSVCSETSLQPIISMLSSTSEMPTSLPLSLRRLTLPYCHSMLSALTRMLSSPWNNKWWHMTNFSVTSTTGLSLFLTSLTLPFLWSRSRLKSKPWNRRFISLIQRKQEPTLLLLPWVRSIWMVSMRSFSHNKPTVSDFSRTSSKLMKIRPDKSKPTTITLTRSTLATSSDPKETLPLTRKSPRDSLPSEP